MADNLCNDMIEPILSKLPVASLLKFKAVSTEWNATISDPRFILAHKNPDSHNIFLAELRFMSAAYLVRLEDGKFRTEAVMAMRDDESIIFVHNGSGMVLLMTRPCMKTYLLWNPCTQQKTQIRYPYHVSRKDNEPYSWGLCPDPSNDDYKVVIVYEDSYAVFSCKNESWSQKRKYPFYVRNYWLILGGGLCVDGAIYWEKASDKRIIIWFDIKDDNFKILDKPQEVEDNNVEFCLKSFNDCLCLCCSEGKEGTSARIWVKEKGTNSWKVLMTMKNMPFSSKWIIGLMVPFEENKILMSKDLITFFIYDVTTKSYTEFKFIEEKFATIHPYHKSLFFPTILKE